PAPLSISAPLALGPALPRPQPTPSLFPYTTLFRSYTDTFSVASADGTPTSVTIHILGTNDAAVLSADTANLTETNSATDISTSGTLTSTHVNCSHTCVAYAGTVVN